MKLAIITHTNPDLNRDISKCMQSVQEALIPDSIHTLIEFKGTLQEMQQARYDAIHLAEYICFVDDDDYIAPNALSKCMNALNGTTLGLAFSNEFIESDDTRIISIPKMTSYEAIINYPETAHHLCVIRSSAVTERSLNLANECGCGIEWIMKAEAAICYGAIHVPDFLYTWVEHDGQHHMIPDVRQKFKENQKKIIDTLKSWATFSGQTLIYTGV